MPFQSSVPTFLAALLCLADASPLTSLNDISSIFNRDTITSPCAPGAQPILYKQYEDSGPCGPAKNLAGLDGDGKIICPGHFDASGATLTCDTWCEAYQKFIYDQEQPVRGSPYCHGPMTCTVSDSQAFTYTYSGQINVGLGSDIAKLVSAGVNGGFSLADARTQLVTKSITLKEGDCGYMTFLPELHESCGTHSKGIWGNNQCNEYTTEYDVCAPQPFRSKDGKEVVGTTVFVKTDCATNERLPMGQQDPAYQHDGVALPQSVFISTFQTCDCNENGCSDVSPPCCDNGSCPVNSNVVGGKGQ